MKVCMLVHQNYFRDQRIIRYAESLLEKGHQVDVICPFDKQLNYMKKKSPVGVRTIPVFHGNSNQIFEYFLEYGIAFFLYFLLLTWRFALRGYDVIHVHNMPDFLVFTAVIPRLLGVKVILDIHDPFPEFYQSKFKASPESNLTKLLYLEEQLSVNFVHAVITANDNFKANLMKRNVPEEKIIVVRNFPDRTVYDRQKFTEEVKREDGKFVLAYPGTIAPRYGLHVAIKGISLLADEFPELELRIIGPETAYKQELRDLVEELGVSSAVRILPAVHMDEVPRTLAMANMGIYPALPDAHMDIAIPTKVLEFTVMGLPVIASRLTVIEQLFEHGQVFLFTPGDHEEFAGIVRKCIRGDVSLEKFIEINDEQLLTEWNWAFERERYYSLLKHLMV